LPILSQDQQEAKKPHNHELLACRSYTELLKNPKKPGRIPIIVSVPAGEPVDHVFVHHLIDAGVQSQDDIVVTLEIAYGPTRSSERPNT